ncbi:MAG: alpha/beta hydrolase [Deltaproteobacteria bacterium]|nr:alpha/beta hydrolase [Deltaproteobacteria bacterium]
MPSASQEYASNSPTNPSTTTWRQRLSGGAIDASFRLLSALAKRHPRANLTRHGVEKIYDLPYLDDQDPSHRLDVYRPIDRTGLLPAVVYLHGGGFRILSKDTHWLMGLLFARAGYVVFNVNYRLAPAHPFPAALEDSADALSWIATHAADYGGDVKRLVFAGESAGANLSASLAIASCQEREEPYAQKIFNLGIVPKVVLPACGMLEVSRPERLFDATMPRWLMDRVKLVSDAYLADFPEGPARALADPLCILEETQTWDRPLPAFFSAVGGRDLLLNDTRRLHYALKDQAVHSVSRLYHGEPHAFHAFIWRAQARQAWRDMIAFTDDTIAA